MSGECIALSLCVGLKTWAPRRARAARRPCQPALPPSGSESSGRGVGCIILPKRGEETPDGSYCLALDSPRGVSPVGSPLFLLLGGRNRIGRPHPAITYSASSLMLWAALTSRFHTVRQAALGRRRTKWVLVTPGMSSRATWQALHSRDVLYSLMGNTLARCTWCRHMMCAAGRSASVAQVQHPTESWSWTSCASVLEFDSLADLPVDIQQLQPHVHALTTNHFIMMPDPDSQDFFFVKSAIPAGGGFKTACNGFLTGPSGQRSPSRSKA